ncbi:MAG: Trm112 family protein [Deltaproteobacteria bacterium]|nr:MAG: Trm112 family protein [Deltaproteobacteria bacterium]
MAISEELLEILVCPACKGPLKMSAEQDALICEACKLRYPIEDDIPVMIVSEAKPLD